MPNDAHTERTAPISPSFFEVDPELLENLETLIETDQQAMVLNLLVDLHPADIALLISHLPFFEADLLIDWLPLDVAGIVVSELDDDYRAELLKTTHPERVRAVVDVLETDDAADVLADLPQEVVEQVMPGLEDAEDLEVLLRYDEESAGGIMGTEFIDVRPTATVADVVEAVRHNAETVLQVYSVYVTDENDHLLGIITLKRLLLAHPDERIGDVMKRDIHAVTVDMDQEEVARMMSRYDLISMPVVDADGCLVGRITIDDIVDVIIEEAEEDIQRMSGVAGGEEPTDKVGRIVRGRLPWLVAGVAGASLAAIVIASFEEALKSDAILAAFIPIVMATAGNAGIQSSAIAVQGLASGDVWDTNVLRRLGKELVVAVINGLIVAIVTGLGILAVESAVGGVFNDPINLALTTGISLLAVIMLAASVGASVPLMLNRMNIDPALATGPFITTSNDILGILIFFLLAQQLYLS